MIVYVDLVFLLNFFINFFLLAIIEIIFKEKINYLRIVFASFIGGGIILAYCLNNLLFTLFQIFGGILIALFAYYHNNPQKIIIKIASFYLINLAVVGLLSIFKITDFYLLLLCLVLVVVIIFFETNKKYYVFINANKYRIYVSFDNYTLDIEGYLDTGNFALSLDNKPLVFIDQKYFKEDLLSNKNVQINTINGLQSVLVYEPQSFYIKMKNKKIYKDVLIVFSDINQNFDCLLNAWLFI